MRSNKDNYFIIKGHTYDEYLRKYRRGIGKGKLLTFKDDELKYLKKSKFYWEVSGPNGETLYCQVYRVKPHHIIVPTVILAVVGGLIATGVILIPKYLKKSFTGEVTEEEWKGSMEDVVHIKETRNLNYKIGESSSFTINDSGSTQVVKNMKVDGNLIEAESIEEGKAVPIYMYRYKQLPLFSYNNENVVSKSYMLNDYLSLPFGDLYNEMKSFSFDKESKSYTYSSGTNSDPEFEYVNTKIAFNKDKKIDHLECSYKMKETDFEFKCECDYSYGGIKLKAWEEDQKFKDAVDKLTVGLKEDVIKKVWLTGELTDFKKDTFIVTTDNDDYKFTLDGMNTIRLRNSNDSSCYSWCKDYAIFVNEQRLERDDSGYKIIFENNPKTGRSEMVGFKLHTPLKSTDKFTFKTSLYWTETSGYNDPRMSLSIE